MRRWLLVWLLLLALVFARSATAVFSPPTLTATASWLAQRPVQVMCLTRHEEEADPVIGGWGAEAYVPGVVQPNGNWKAGDFAVFRGKYCHALLALARGDASQYTATELAVALLIFTHESGHLRGASWSGNESRTECWAVRHVGYVAHRFGVTDLLVRQLLVSLAVAEHYTLPPDPYRKTPCELPDV